MIVQMLTNSVSNLNDLVQTSSDFSSCKPLVREVTMIKDLVGKLGNLAQQTDLNLEIKKTTKTVNFADSICASTVQLDMSDEEEYHEVEQPEPQCFGQG